MKVPYVFYVSHVVVVIFILEICGGGSSHDPVLGIDDNKCCYMHLRREEGIVAIYMYLYIDQHVKCIIYPRYSFKEDLTNCLRILLIRCGMTNSLWIETLLTSQF